MIIRTAIRMMVLAFGLSFSVTAEAQQREPEARRAAAFADYHRSCASEISTYRSQAGEIDNYFREARVGWNGQPTDLAGTQRLYSYTERALAAAAARVGHLAHAEVKMCAHKVALRHAKYGVPGYDSSTGTAAPARPAPRPSVTAEATRPAQAPKLLKARPAKAQPWSPKAMPTDPKRLLSPRFAAERADALAGCSAIMTQYAAHLRTTPVEISLITEQAALNDEAMGWTADLNRQSLAKIEHLIVSRADDPGMVFAYKSIRCVRERRVAQLEGSPLIAGAVNGTLTPLSIGGSTPPWKQQGKDAHIIASNGKSAKDCVFLETIASGDSNMSGAVKGRVLVNRCSDEVEIGWCYAPGDCNTETGSGWTIQPGRSWPINAQGEVRWAACHGANTTSFVKYSHGLRYYCKAPAQSAKR